MATSWCDEFLPQVATLLQKKLDVRDRKHHLKTYKKCFVATEAIDLMVQQQIVESREEAIRLGQELQTKIGLWHHVCNDHIFKGKSGRNAECVLLHSNADLTLFSL